MMRLEKGKEVKKECEFWAPIFALVSALTSGIALGGVLFASTFEQLPIGIFDDLGPTLHIGGGILAILGIACIVGGLKFSTTYTPNH